MSHRSRQDGFSLLEVVVAFAILVLTMTMFYEAYAGGMRNVFRADAQYQAMERAKSRLALLGTVIRLSPARLSGTFEDGALWTVVIEPYSGPGHDAGPLGLAAYRVTVDVTWGSGDARRFSLKTIKLAAQE